MGFPYNLPPTWFDKMLFGLHRVFVNGVLFPSELAISIDCAYASATDNPNSATTVITFGPSFPDNVGSVYTASATLSSSRDQLVAISSGGGAFVLDFPATSTMLVGDVFRIEDWGNTASANHVTLDLPAAHQDPNTYAISTGAYVVGADGYSGVAFIWRYVLDPTLGYYLKVIA